MNNAMKSAAVALVLAVGMILSASLLSRLFLRIRHEQAITVKGYAGTNIVSDVGRLSCICSARGNSLKDAYGKLESNRKATLTFLKQLGLCDSETTVFTIETSKVAKRDPQGRETNEIEYYDLTQEIQVLSTNVTLIRETANRITELIQSDVDIRASAPAFMISDLKDTKLRLLQAATDDGYRRALALAEGSKGKIGALISAQQGVFQITEPHSTDTSGYGEYDTSTIEKSAKAVVTLEYAIESRP